MKRLFVGIAIDAEGQLLDFLKTLRFCSMQGDKVNWVAPHLMHITLKFIGEIPAQEIPYVIQAIQKSIQNVEPFSLIINRIGVFGSRYQPRVLWLGFQNEPVINSLAERLQKELHKLGIPKEIYRFIPHLTLARINRIKDKKHFWKVIESHQSNIVHYQFFFREVHLYESVLTPIEPVYTEIYTAKLEIQTTSQPNFRDCF